VRIQLATFFAGGAGGCAGDGGVAAELGGEPAQGAHAPLVAAVAQLGVQPLGAADPFVPSLLQVGLVRAEQAGPHQADAAGQLIGACGGGVAADRLGIQP
jgi:hypothetical protein